MLPIRLSTWGQVMNSNNYAAQHLQRASPPSEVDGCDHEQQDCTVGAAKQRGDDLERESRFEIAQRDQHRGMDGPVHGEGLCLARTYRVLFQPLCGLIKHAFGLAPPEPEEVAQIAFEKLIRYRQRDQIRDLKAWLFIAARHVILDHNRRRKLSEHYAAEQVAFKSIHLTEQMTPDSILDQRDRFRIVTSAMARLPEHQRAMIILNRIDGCSYRAISKKTGWSIGYISGQLNDALGQLTKALERSGRPASSGHAGRSGAFPRKRLLRSSAPEES